MGLVVCCLLFVVCCLFLAYFRDWWHGRIACGWLFVGGTGELPVVGCLKYCSQM